MADCSPSSLVAKPLGNLYYDSSSNFQSNDQQQVQFNTDLFKQEQRNLYRNEAVN